MPVTFHLPLSGQNDLIALTGNLTVTGASTAGFVSLSPDPNSTNSTINFRAGDTRANNVTVPIAPGGALTLTLHGGAGSKADVILDVTGLYRDGGGDGFWPLSPVRVLDSRTTGSSPFQANVSQLIKVAGVATIPANATAVTGNLTVTNPTRAGYVSVTTDPTNSPATSTINFAAGDTRANGLTIPVGSGGQVSAIYKACERLGQPDPGHYRLLQRRLGRPPVPSAQSRPDRGYPAAPRPERLPQRPERSRRAARRAASRSTATTGCPWTPRP